MSDATDRVPAFEPWLTDTGDEEVELDFSPGEQSDGQLWEWNGIEWVAVVP
jgi:hypothetical protein